MIFLALLAVLLDGVTPVPASKWTSIPVDVREPGMVVEASISVPPSASRVQAWLLTASDHERFERGRSIRALYATGFQKTAHFRYRVHEPGRYFLLIDNRIEGRFAVPVRLRVELWSPGVTQARTLPPEKRNIVIALSLLFFGAVVAFSARQFLKNS